MRYLILLCETCGAELSCEGARPMEPRGNIVGICHDCEAVYLITIHASRVERASKTVCPVRCDTAPRNSQTPEENAAVS